jgi:hypothetical protein
MDVSDDFAHKEGNMPDGDDILWRSVTEALSLLGESSMKLVIWELTQRGIRFVKGGFDISEFASSLQDLFGDGADVILNAVYYRLNNNLPLLDLESNIDPNEPPLEKILRVMKSRTR